MNKKSLIGAIGILAVSVCLACTVSAEESANPVKKYLGLYDNDSGNVLVSEDEDGVKTDLSVYYYGESDDYSMWNMTGELDPATLTLSYTDGVRTDFIWNAENLEYTQEVVYENCAGSFAFSDDLTLVWTPGSEEPVKDTTYNWFSFASAEDSNVVTEDGVLSMDLPTPQWQVVPDSSHWFVISDGDDLITIDHLQNGQNLPAPSVADRNYAAVYHTFVSTRNEVFVVKGCAVDQKDLEMIMNAVSTVRILKFDTKTALASPAPQQTSSYTLKPVNDYYYVLADPLNVRETYSTDSNAIGSLELGSRIFVTAMVQKDGKDIGWAQIRLNNGGTAYVSSKFLAKVDPEEDKKPEYDEVTIYAKDGSWVKVFREKGTFGNWQDSHGIQYTEIEGNAHLFYDNTNGTYFSEYKEYWEEMKEAEQAEQDVQTQTMVLYAENGAQAIVTGHAGDEVWTDSNGGKYHWIDGSELLYDEAYGLKWTYIEGYWGSGQPSLDDGGEDAAYQETSSEEWSGEESTVEENSGYITEEPQAQFMQVFLDAEGLSQAVLSSSQDPSIWVDNNGRSYKKVKEENGIFVFYDEVDRVFWCNSRSFWESHTKQELSDQYNLPI